MRLNRTQRPQSRKGAIAVLAAVLSIVFVAMVAFSVDVGYVLSAKEELQRTADASAMAACWEFGSRMSQGSSASDAAGYARDAAIQYAGLNKVTRHGMTIDPNLDNSPDGDVVFGYISNFDDPEGSFQTNDSTAYNAVRVRMHKDSSANGEVPFFFARVFGLDGQVLHTEAIAAIVRDVGGFQAPSDGSNIDLLPFSLDINTWQSLVNNSGTDKYKWNPTTKQVEAGADGLVEVNLFPQGTGPTGNRGTVDIGGSNNSIADLARQIVEGVSPQDMADFASEGRTLELDPNGQLFLNGDTGISAGVKDELGSIKGKPRAIPVFEAVSGNGNNAEYTIVKWQGIRVMAVKLTGSMSQKHVMIQVAPVQTKGVVPSPVAGTSSYVYSNVALVQ